MPVGKSPGKQSKISKGKKKGKKIKEKRKKKKYSLSATACIPESAVVFKRGERETREGETRGGKRKGRGRTGRGKMTQGSEFEHVATLWHAPQI